MANLSHKYGRPFKGLRRASPGYRKRFEHGEPIAKIDTRPMVFVFAFLAIVIAISRYPGFDLWPHVDLSVSDAEPVRNIEDQFVVTVTTTSIQKGESWWDRALSGDHGECRVYVGDGIPVSSDELYDYAFSRLDAMVIHGGGVEVVTRTEFLDIPPALVRADRYAPWQCVAGVLYIVERAGYAETKFLTEPTA